MGSKIKFTKMDSKSNLVVVTWDGVSVPFKCVHFNAQPEFKILLFNYSGNNILIPDLPYVDFFINQSTENKGQVFEAVYQYLKQEQLHFNYIGFIDDDIFFSITAFNEMLHIATQQSLNVFQPSIAKDSYYSHRKFVHQAGYYVTRTDWVEIMAPFYEQFLFEACQPYFKYSISGQGIDCYIMPCIQKIHNKINTGVVHAAMIKHTRPIRTHLRTYGNGLTGIQEMAILKKKAIELTENHDHKAVFDADFKLQYFTISDPQHFSFFNKLKQLKNICNNLLSRAKEMAHFN
jgi:hypothetical protein